MFEVMYVQITKKERLLLDELAQAELMGISVFFNQGWRNRGGGDRSPSDRINVNSWGEREDPKNTKMGPFG